jgi:large subunit ribosomal protein L29
MKYTELQDKTLEELKTLLKEKKVELFESKIKLRTMQLQDSSVIRKIKKDIARINTAISAKG